MKNVSRTNKKGFTLVELLVVIGIIGLLAAIILPKFTGYTQKAIMKDAVSQARKTYTDVTAYYAEKGKYPLAKGAVVAAGSSELTIDKVVDNVAVADISNDPTVPTISGDKNYLMYNTDGSFTFYFVKGGKTYTVAYSNQGAITETPPA